MYIEHLYNLLPIHQETHYCWEEKAVKRGLVVKEAALTGTDYTTKHTKKNSQHELLTFH